VIVSEKYRRTKIMKILKQALLVCCLSPLSAMAATFEADSHTAASSAQVEQTIDFDKIKKEMWQHEYLEKYPQKAEIARILQTEGHPNQLDAYYVVASCLRSPHEETLDPETNTGVPSLSELKDIGALNSCLSYFRTVLPTLTAEKKFEIAAFLYSNGTLADLASTSGYLREVALNAAHPDQGSAADRLFRSHGSDEDHQLGLQLLRQFAQTTGHPYQIGALVEFFMCGIDRDWCMSLFREIAQTSGHPYQEDAKRQIEYNSRYIVSRVKASDNT
jgi:hypothetical protein